MLRQRLLRGRQVHHRRQRRPLLPEGGRQPPVLRRPVGRAAGDCCPAPEYACGDGSGTPVRFDEQNSGGGGVTCNERTQVCHEGQCRNICSLNTEDTVECDDGVQHWCCPTRSPVCRKPHGAPHCG
jgi:hypothetical protein